MACRLHQMNTMSFTISLIYLIDDIIKLLTSTSTNRDVIMITRQMSLEGDCLCVQAC